MLLTCQSVFGDAYRPYLGLFRTSVHLSFSTPNERFSLVVHAMSPDEPRREDEFFSQRPRKRAKYTQTAW